MVGPVVLVAALFLLFAVPVMAEYNNPYHANVDGVDYSVDDVGENFTFWVTIYSEDDTGDSTPVRWEAVEEDDDGNTSVVISHNITDPNEVDGHPIIHSEASYILSDEVDLLEFRAYDSEHGYGGATVAVDFASQDFRSQEAEDVDTGGGGTGGDDGTNDTEEDEADNDTGPAPAGETDDADEDTETGDRDDEETAPDGEETDEADDDDSIGDRVTDRIPGMGEDDETDTGTGMLMLLALIGAFTVIGVIEYRRYRD